MRRGNQTSRDSTPGARAETGSGADRARLLVATIMIAAVALLTTASSVRAQAEPTAGGESPATTDEEALRAAARFLAESDDLDGAIDIIDQLRALHPDDPELLETQLDLCMRSPACEPRRADLLREAMRVLPERPDLVETLLAALIQQGRIDEGIQVVRAYLEGHPDDRDLRYWLVESLIAAGEIDEAVVELRRLKDYHRYDLDVRIFVVETLETEKRYKELDAQLALLVEDFPSSADAWALHGQRLLERNDIESAKRILAHALKLPPASEMTVVRVASLQRDIQAMRGGAYPDFRREVEWSDFEEDHALREDY